MTHDALDVQIANALMADGRARQNRLAEQLGVSGAMVPNRLSQLSESGHLRDFVERAESHHVRAQRIEFPDYIPRSVEASWTSIQDTLYVLTVLFGVLTLPKVTLNGVWKGKGGHAWQEESIKVDCRGPKVEELLRRDMDILDAAVEE